MKAKTKPKPKYVQRSRLPITDEDICVVYANQIARTVASSQDVLGLENCMFLVLLSNERRSFSRVSAPKHWCTNGSSEDVYPVLSDVFRESVRKGFQLSLNDPCSALYTFMDAFDRRLKDDCMDDPRIRNVVFFGAHPEGYGVLTCLRGIPWATRQVARELLVDLETT
ncbi:hypothetical protein CCP3SC1AL1_900004 [Gammaproteobacteria bacterium]